MAGKGSAPRFMGRHVAGEAELIMEQAYKHGWSELPPAYVNSTGLGAEAQPEYQKFMAQGGLHGKPLGYIFAENRAKGLADGYAL